MSFVRLSLRFSDSWKRIFPTVRRSLVRSTLIKKFQTPLRILLLPTAVGIIRAAPTVQTDLTSLKHTILQADHLFDSNKFQELYNLLFPLKDSDQVELLWRFARAAYKLSLQDSAKKLQLLTEGYEAAKHSLELDDRSAAAHKWMAILLDAYTEAQSFRERCKNIVAVKDHMTRSVELDPTDATVWYMLGVWYYEMSDLSWYKVKILNAVGGITYKSSYEEALACFEEAEKIDPNFYSLNHLMLGKTYLKLDKNKDKAIAYLEKAAEVPVLTSDDRKAKKEALDILKGLQH